MPKEHTDRLQQLFETMATGVVFQSRSGEIIAANPAASRILGRSHDDLVGRTSNDATWQSIHRDGSPFPGDEHPAMVALRTGKPVHDVVMGVRVPGQSENEEPPDVQDYRWLLINAIPRFHDGESEPCEVYVTFDDISALMLVEEAAQASEERFRRVVESSPMGIHMYRLEPGDRLVFTGANPSADRILDVDNSQFVGKTIEEAFPPLTQTEVPAAYRRLCRERNGEWHQEQIIYQDRQIAGAFEVHAFSTGQAQMATLFLDITDRKRAQAALNESRERLELVLRGAGLGTWDWYIESGDMVFDERAAALLGYALGELNPHISVLEELTHPDDLPHVKTLLEAHLAGESASYEAEYRLKTKSDGWIWVVSRGRVVERDDDDRPRRATGTLLDITERKQAEAEHAKLQGQMQQAQKLESLGVLAGGIAHDFNNLLCGVVGAADLALSDLPVNHPVTGDLEQIRETGLRATELCRQLLAYSGKGRFVVEPVSLTEVVDSITQLIKVSVSKRASLRYELSNDLPAVEADVTQLRQIVLNLVVNASEAIGSENGTITVYTGSMDCDREYLKSAYIDDDLPAGTYVFLEVADTGCGMEPETLKRLFDPFFTTKFTGRGLGLAATLGIVRGHRGTVKVYSEPSRGATFKVLLPATDRDCLRRPEAAQTRWRGSGKVLLVDDEETVRTIGKRMLETMGFDVLLASDGQAGLEAFRAHAEEIVLVLLDMTMPRMSGTEAYRELRRVRPDVAVILISGYNEQEATSRFAGKGLAGFVQKPFVLETVRQAVRSALEQPTTKERE
jgi:PAS domain S-box-containing protein